MRENHVKNGKPMLASLRPHHRLMWTDTIIRVGANVAAKGSGRERVQALFSDSPRLGGPSLIRSLSLRPRSAADSFALPTQNGA